jgi:hypothetical protein
MLKIAFLFIFPIQSFLKNDMKQKKFASAGNRTRAARVAGEHSTTEPPMLVK